MRNTTIWFSDIATVKQERTTHTIKAVNIRPLNEEELDPDEL